MSGALSVQRIGERIIRGSCRQFTADVGADLCREWTAELAAILDDAGIRSSFRRALRALAFCIGVARATRQLSRLARAGSGRAGNGQRRIGTPPSRSGGTAVRVAVGLAVWLVVVAGFIAVDTGFHLGARLVLAAVPLGVGFDAYCLTDIVRAADVRCLRKWVWALICVAQMPLGGILYITVGRPDPAQPGPPGTSP